MPDNDKEKERISLKEYHKQWYLMNKDRFKKQMREYYQKNREQIRLQVKKQLQLPEVKEKRKEYRQRPEIKTHRKEYMKQWRERNKERIIEYNQRPEIKERTKQSRNTPEKKEKTRRYRKEYSSRPEIKVYKKIYRKNYDKRPDRIFKSRESTKKRRILQREITFKHYGNKCICCGEIIPEFLSIDHASGGGYKHRKQIGGHINQWLIKNNFPQGFQLLCMNCNWGKARNGGICPHKQKISMQMNTNQKYILKHKQKVFNHYGNKCNCCGETIPEFLSIDHINGGGTKHRKAIGKSNFYAWLINNNFPEEYQTLCMNCNWGKRMNAGVCPHKKTS